MEICFTKRKEGEHIISCKRKDGSTTWMQVSSFFIMHDLCHYAAETILEFKNSFYGLLAAGRNISDFDLPRERRTFPLPEEAIFTEHLVNLLLIEYNQGRVEDFTDTLFRHDELKHLPVVYKEKITANLDTIRNRIQELAGLWRILADETALTLNFEE